MNPFMSRLNSNSPVLALSAMALLLGFMMSRAWITQEARATRLGGLDPDQQTRVGSGSVDLQEQYNKLQQEVTKLRKDNTELQNVLAKDQEEKTKLDVINKSLQETKAFAGLTEVQGEGIEITLRDGVDEIDAPLNDKVVHDVDVLRVVNELWNAGAEAVAVNGNRIVIGSNIRCAGAIILVDNIKIASPVLIQAIGKMKTLYGAMQTPGGILAELKGTDERMVEIHQVQKLVLPAYSGPTKKDIMKETK